MRTSILTRSAIAVATLALGAGALAVTPASAAPATSGKPSEITRAQVLAAAAFVRAHPEASNPSGGDPATLKVLRPLANRACSVDYDQDVVFFALGSATQAGQSADGLIVGALIADPGALSSEDGNPFADGRTCIFGAVAAKKGSTSLTGTGTLTTTSAQKYALSRDVFVTPARNFTQADSGNVELDEIKFTATGAAKTPITVKVTDKKTKSEKKAAKKKYDKRLKSYKKSYKKALDKAGSSKTKKAAAKKAYSSKKASAKAKYKYAIAGYKLVKRTSSAGFNLTAKFADPESPSAAIQ